MATQIVIDENGKTVEHGFTAEELAELEGNECCSTGMKNACFWIICCPCACLYTLYEACCGTGGTFIYTIVTVKCWLNDRI